MEDDNIQNSDPHLVTLARGTGVNMVGVACRVGLGFLHSLLAARWYGAEAYGVYSVGIAAVGLLSFAGQLGFGRTLTHFVAHYWAKGEPNKIIGTLKIALGIAVPASVGIGLIMTIGARWMSNLFGGSTLVSPFRVLGFAVPMLTLAMLLSAFTEGFKRMRYKTIALEIVRPGVELLGLTIFTVVWKQELVLSVSYTLSITLASVLLFFFAKSDLQRVVKSFPASLWTSSAMPVKPILDFAIPVLANNILVTAATRASVLILGAIGTSTMVGVFSILNRLAQFGTTFMYATSSIFAPIISDLVGRGQLSQLSRLYKISTRWTLMISLPFFLILVFWGAEILGVFGREFVYGASALMYLIPAAIFDVATGSAGFVLIFSGRPHYSAINEAVMLLSVIGLNLLLTPSHGLLGAVWSLAIATVIVNSLRVVQVWHHLRIQPYGQAYLKIVPAALAMTIFLLLWRGQILQADVELLMLAVGGVLASIIYGAVISLLGLEKNELEMLRLLRRRLIGLLSN